MIRAMWSAASGMQAQQTNMDVISNNLANVNTTAFKYSRASFQDLLYANMRPAGSETAQTGTQVPTGIQLGHGVKTVAVSKEFTQGSLVPTAGGPFDVNLSISGQGFFQIEKPDGTIAYTRDGSFTIDKDGNMVTADGYPLVGGKSVKPPGDSSIIGVTISPSGGNVYQQKSGVPNPIQTGTIELANFINPAGLTSVGNNLYLESMASGPPILGKPDDNNNGMGSLKQATLEQSNVNMVTEMVNMISTQRAYEIGTKAIQTVDAMLGLAATLKQ
ncbi:MAG: flagellar basal-body rod protein FlgG [Magnetococcales bacterium]|nr:flagellar basal-body rod protein FlgG [Magnetococcales bacterium]